jgi:ferredoxin
VKVRLDDDLCVGHGRCYALAPELFDADDQGHCVVRHDVVPAGLEEQAATGVANCPEDALSIVDD